MHTNPSLVRQIFDQAFNLGNLSIVDESVSAAGITHMASWGVPPSRMGLKQLISAYRIAFPDLHCTVEDEIHQGNKLAAHWTMRGTHKGDFFGSRPTGRLVEVQGIIFARVANGQIVEYWTLIDEMSMLQQLGIVPPTKSI